MNNFIQKQISISGAIVSGANILHSFDRPSIIREITLYPSVGIDSGSSDTMFRYSVFVQSGQGEPPRLIIHDHYMFTKGGTLDLTLAASDINMKVNSTDMLILHISSILGGGLGGGMSIEES